MYDTGQFYYRRVRIQPYFSPELSDSGPHFRVTVPARSPDEPERSFIGQYYQLNWVFAEKQSLYVGNSQAGPEFPELSDSVIADDLEDYSVNEPFTELGFRFGLFNSDLCNILTDTPPTPVVDPVIN